MMAHLFIFVKY